MTKPIIWDEQEQTEAEKKQAMLAAIIDSSEDAIISKTLEGIITTWNGAAERMFGYTEAEIIGKHISVLIPTERLQEEDMIIDSIRKGLRIQHFQTVRLRKDGRTIPISLSVSPIKSRTGMIIGASKIARDISELQKHARNLEVLVTMGKTISEKLDMQFILQKVTDATTKLTGAEFGAFFYNNIDEKGENYLLYTLSGVPKEAFEGFPMPRNTDVFRTTFNGEGIIRSDDISKDPRYGRNAPYHGMPKGHLPVVSYLAVPVTSSSGKTIGGLFFGHSRPGIFTAEHEQLVTGIAAQAAIATDNAKLYEEIKLLNSRKDEFIGVAGHELRTPITTIKGYLQLLETQVPDGFNKEFTERALHQVNKLNRLISDILDVSKIHAGKLDYNMTPTPLLPLIRESVETVRQIHGSHKIETDLPPDDLIITADGTKIEQVVINFLTNAIKYSPGADTVFIRVERQQDRVIVSVRDLGIGIPREHINHLFQRYYRVSQSHHAIGGLGIGLFISREIVEQHKGSIWVESVEGKGSTFYFSLSLFLPE